MDATLDMKCMYWKQPPPLIFILKCSSRAHDDAPEPFSLASNFLRAARIISSLLRCKLACLSFLSCDHAFFFPVEESVVGDSGVVLSFEAKL